MPRTSLCSRISKIQRTWGSTKAACQFSWGRGRQAMHLPCKQADVGALPTDSTILIAGRMSIQASLISSASVGATPTPATTAYAGSPWEMIQLSDCKPDVVNKIGSDDWSVTSIAHHHFGLVAQSEEQPVVCGKAEGASPFGSATFRSYRGADSQGFGLAFLHSDVVQLQSLGVISAWCSSNTVSYTHLRA